MTTNSKPDGYAEENAGSPPSVTDVETAIPAFIGYTQIAKKSEENDLILKPTQISSLKEYEGYFGYPKDDLISIAVTGDTSGGFNAIVEEPPVSYLMYYGLKMFFDNGGGKCYIVSVGLYQDIPDISLHGNLTGSDPARRYGLLDGLDAAALEDEPALIIFPESIKLPSDAYQALVQAALTQCGKSGDRFCIFDLYNGSTAIDTTTMATDRSYFGYDNLAYCAAYYPFLKSTLNFYINPEETNVIFSYDDNKGDHTGNSEGASLISIKSQDTALYNFIKSELQNHFVVLPPGSAVAGVYATVDASRGVWEAPANIGLTTVIEPVIQIDITGQENLNVDAATGKSINAIRTFPGKGTLVWGARTLAGNDNEWRYISVKRFFMMVEKSVKRSIGWVASEPNDENTWSKIRGVLENYLTQKWRDGALAGATSNEAFYVQCGLGITMNEQDIASGKINIVIGMAMIRPAEFITLSISQEIRTS